MDIYESPIDNIIFNEPSSPNFYSPKNSDKDMHASRTYDNSPIQTRKGVTPLVPFGFKTQQQP